MNIINLIVSAITATISVIFSVKNFSKTKLTLKIFLIHFFIMFPLLSITNIFVSGLVKIFLTILLTALALYFSIFNKNINKSLYYSVVYEVLAFIVEIILSVVFVSVFNFNLENYNSFSLSLLIFTILNGLIIYLISCIKKLDNIIYKYNEIIMKKKYEIIYLFMIVLLLTLMLVFNGDSLSKNLSFYINVGMVIFVFVTLIFIAYRDIQNNNLETKYNEMMDYVCKYEKIINDQGKKNHEYNNQLMVIKGYSKNPEKLEEYLNLVIDEHKCGQNYTIRQLSSFPDGGIKGLIYHKLSKMEDNDIKCYLYIDKNIKDIFEERIDVNTYRDITKLLGVFLDNAIEAAMNADKKEIDLEIKMDDDCIIITIGNTYDKNNDINQIGKKGFTTKGIGHGYGLSIVKDIMKHNQDTFNDVTEEVFKQTIMIYYKK